ncbi:hypothetical protein [Sphingobium chlorophenolicum]|uniref:Uncharacterized protein n=1 Tax=Sphingobium chlorophenolicum TaxID=46429 RepID=A0A081RAD0_SPHCR|nr:hypothetical protein [Sphingobium chlorophenolicum]KEQ52153.1 hypothetical protein BV95_03570 [Sphingobium chlorophenolicum]
MAAYPVRAESVRANPSSQRRAVLAALVAAPFAGSALIAHAENGVSVTGETAMNMHTAIRKRENAHLKWDRALARYREAKELNDTFVEKIYEPAHDELWRRAPMPEDSFTITAKSGRSCTYRYSHSGNQPWHGNPTPAIKEAGEKLEKEWKDWIALNKKIANELNVYALDDEYDLLARVQYEYGEILLSTPAPNASALLIKLDLLWEVGRDGDVLREHVLRDLRAISENQLDLM